MDLFFSDGVFLRFDDPVQFDIYGSALRLLMPLELPYGEIN
jgi:hypothetical protein